MLTHKDAHWHRRKGRSSSTPEAGHILQADHDSITLALDESYMYDQEVLYEVGYSFNKIIAV